MGILSSLGAVSAAIGVVVVAVVAHVYVLRVPRVPTDTPVTTDHLTLCSHLQLLYDAHQERRQWW